MENSPNSKKFTKWLNKLQQESWQLELIVSGFVIFGLFEAIEPVKEMFSVSGSELSAGYVYAMFASLIGFSVTLSMHLLLFNLMIHLVLRGLWIGAIGLRYYSGEIDYDYLNYSDRFQNYLKKKIGSFDNYIKKLEDYCSIIFSLSFLLVFIFLSFGIVFSTILLPVSFIDTEGGKITMNTVYLVLVFIFLLMILLTIIDFFGQGVLKRNSTVSKVYFPIYKVMSYITLSFLYRPILYNFLDHKKGRRILFWLFPFYIGVSIFATLGVEQSNFHTYQNSDSPNFIENAQYLSEIALDKKLILNGVAIESKRVFEPALQVFIAHTRVIENSVVEKTPNIKPLKDKRGLQSELFLDTNYNTKKGTMNFEQYLDTLNSNITIKIDDQKYRSDFLAARISKTQRGYETHLNLEGLTKGKHYLLATTTLTQTKNKKLDTLGLIPFWYFGK